MKPRISILCPWWIQIPRLRWRCCREDGLGPQGFGFTPQLAYEDWFNRTVFEAEMRL